MSDPAVAVVHPAYVIGQVDRRLFGSFVEHLGRGVYGGLYDPGHPQADADGLRQDVLALVRELGVTTVRYPGGNFVSAHDWRDGVGPREQRPRRLDPAWHSIETNQFGLNEFIAWTRLAEVEPMLALNLGTGGLRDALELLEYTNHPGGTTISDQRIAHGMPQPHDVRLWCLGNEMDGSWQVGHLSATEYASRAAAVAAAMRRIDPGLELVVVGSSNAEMDTFGAWEREVLTRTIDLVDYVSCHQYFRNNGDLPQFLESGVRMDRFIESIAATITHVKAATSSTRDVRISFDEWNVWDFTAHDAIEPELTWRTAPPLLEDRYTLADAVVVGDLLISLFNHADWVRAASLAQLVNVIGPIVTEPAGGGAWRQTTFHPFAAAARSVGRDALRVAVRCDLIASAEYGQVPAVSVAATYDRVGGELEVFCAHRGLSSPVELHLDLTGFGPIAQVSGQVLAGPDPMAENSAQRPDHVAPRPIEVRRSAHGVDLDLDPLSWAVVRVGRVGR